jgi:hypothetical protein
MRQPGHGQGDRQQTEHEGEQDPQDTIPIGPTTILTRTDLMRAALIGGLDQGVDYMTARHHQPRPRHSAASLPSTDTANSPGRTLRFPG